MAIAKLRIELPPDTWIREVSKAHPEATFRVLAALPGEGKIGTGLLEITAEEMRAVLTAVEDHEGITAVELLQAGENDALVQFETNQPFLLMSVRNSMLPMELPLTIVNGEASLELTATQSSLAEFTEQLEQFGMSYEVDYLRQTLSSSNVLRKQQRELLVEAVRAGYYDTPRECTLTQLAERLGIAKSTLSERLHRIEGTVLKEFISEELVDEQTPR